MKTTQKQTNPYPNTDSNKRYYTYDYYLRRTFGCKCVKIPLDIGCTCPNIDGRCGVGGCIYCSGRGSGDFALPSNFSVQEQYHAGVERLSQKWKAAGIIPYFQAHTNTYAPVEFLRGKFFEALMLPGTVGINIATRADCLDGEVLELLASLAEKTTLTVELGLQSAKDETAAVINRGHTFDDFCRGFFALRAASPKLRIGVHLINGLPGESAEDMLYSVAAVAGLQPDEVKLHLLYVLRGTRLADMYESGEYRPLSMEEYVEIVTGQLLRLPPDTVIGRITGDGAPQELIAPLWSRKKLCVMNEIDKRLYRENSWQGMNFIG